MFLLVMRTLTSRGVGSMHTLGRYGERYSDMEDFHTALPSFVKPGGVYSFFNGMCPFNIFFHGGLLQIFIFNFPVCYALFIDKRFVHVAVALQWLASW